MANIIGKRGNNENSGELSAVSRAKALSMRNFSVKKQAFGEIKNVMNNQQLTTPFKGGNHTPFENPKAHCGGGGGGVGVGVGVLRSQQTHNSNELQRKSEKQSRPTVSRQLKKTFTDDITNWDFSNIACMAQCRKTEEEIWSEMNMINDALLDKVLDGGDSDSDVELDHANLLKHVHSSIEYDPVEPILPLFGTDLDTFSQLDNESSLELLMPNFDDMADYELPY